MPIKSLLKPEIKKALTDVAQWELYSSHLYLYVANQSQKLGLIGSYKYFKIEANEELGHYNILSTYVNDRGDILDVPQIEKVDENAGSLKEILNTLYETMILIENAYKKAYKTTESSDDCVTATFLQKFLKIQRKAIGLYGDLIARLELNHTDLMLMDDFIKDLIPE